MQFDKNLAAKLLGHTLKKLFSRESVMEAMGMKVQDQPDGFWEAQLYMVVNRFYSYLLHSLGMPLTLERDELTVEQFGLLTFAAQANLRQGLHYRDVRDWWLDGGSFLHEQAFAAKRRDSLLARRGIRVMVFFEDQAPKQKPKYLGYADGKPVLVDTKEQAHCFAALCETELEHQSLREAEALFANIARQFSASSIKLVAGSR